MNPTFNADRVRLWIDALARYPQGACALRAAYPDEPEPARYCVIGVAVDQVRQFGTGVSVEPGGGFNFGGDAGQQCVTDWYGVDPWMVVDLDALPSWLRARADYELGSDEVVIDRRDASGRAVSLWQLNDAGMAFHDLAHVIRCAVGLDLHRVPGTAQYAAARAEAAVRATEEAAAAVAAAESLLRDELVGAA